MKLGPVLILLVFFALPVTAGPGHEEPAEPAADHGHEGVEGPEMYTNDTWSHTFTEVGTFSYHCHPHPWMQAEIEVMASNGSAPVNHTINVVEPEDFEQWTFDPVALTVRVGDTVTWVNPGAVMHKVAETTDEHAAHIAGAGSTVSMQGDGHDHVHDEGGSSFNRGVLWVLGGLLGGIGIAQWAKKQSP